VYRSRLLAEAGFRFEAVAAEVDERSFDAQFDPAAPHQHAIRLAIEKATDVGARRHGSVVIGADQIAVYESAAGPQLLHKAPTEEAAVAQLLKLSGTRHQLINGLAVLDTRVDQVETAHDVATVTFREITAEDATRYVREYEPFDCVGSYRLEDDAGFVVEVQAEDERSVIGLPILLLERMLDRLD
jgi:MAF protein